MPKVFFFIVGTKFTIFFSNKLAAVTAALARTNYLECHSCPLSPVNSVSVSIPDSPGSAITSTITVTQASVTTLEHTVVTVSITHSARGDLRIELISPAGTVSVLALPRVDIDNDYVNWNFMTRFNWGESPLGTWTLRIRDELEGDVGSLVSWNLKFYGPCNAEEIVCDEEIPDESDNTPVEVISCFIATASFGHQDASVKTLRQFRDTVLMNSFFGKELVNIYYHISPPIASWIAKHEVARAVTRTMLTPIVQFVQYLF